MSGKISRYSVALLAVLAVTFAGVAARAQSAVSGSITGTVTDSSGAVIVGATVTLTNTDRGQDLRTLKTNSAGFFTAGSLPLGTYSVTFSAQGFRAENVKGLVLHVNDALTVNRSLSPGNVSDTVTVNASDVYVNLENASSEGLINSVQIEQ